MRIVLAIVWVLSFFPASAQEKDSVKTHYLSEVVVLGKTKDTLQNFYRANTGITTETILARMKGVSLIRRGPYGQEPVFRGLNSGQLNVTIDGMKMFGACTDKMDPVTIYVEPVNLSQIQAAMGPQGSVFGSTIGGSLNMQLAQPIVDNKISGTAGGDSQSSANALNHYSSVNVGRKSSAYRSSLAIRKSNNYREGGGQEVMFSRYQKINFTLAGKWAIAKTDTLVASALIDKGKDIGFPALSMDVGKADAGLYSVTYSHHQPWLIFHPITVKAYYNSIYHVMDDSKRPDVLQPMDMSGRSGTWGGFMETDIRIFHQHKTSLRVDYFKNDLIGEMTMYGKNGSSGYMQNAPASTRQDWGIFISQQWLLNSKNKFLFSFRGDRVNDYLKPGVGADQLNFYNNLKNNNSKFIKTVSLNYKRKIIDGLHLEFTSGYGERMPTLNEKYGFFLFNRFDNYDYLGNPFLQPEKTINAEVTAHWVRSRFELQFSPFYQSIGNYIRGGITADKGKAMTHGAKGVKTYSNVSRTELKGFDVMILAGVLRNMQLTNSIKYTYGVIIGEGAMPLIPPLKSVTSIRWQGRKTDIQGEWEFAASQNNVSTLAGEEKTPGYSIFNLRGGFKVTSKLKINMGLENIFDRRYREHLDWGGIMRPGRNAYINLNYSF